MATIDTAAVVLHVLFAGLWAGGVAFYAWRVHPAIAGGGIDAAAADRLVAGLQWLTRASAVVFLVTGGYLYGERLAGAPLLGSGRGHLVVAMLGLWLALVALVEVVAGRLRGLDAGHAAAAGETSTLVALAGLVAVAVLVVGGLVAA